MSMNNNIMALQEKEDLIVENDQVGEFYVNNDGEREEFSQQKEPQTEPDFLLPDEYMELVGGFGLYQIRSQVIFMFFVLVLTSQIFMPYFVIHDPPWTCKHNSTVCTYNETITPQSQLFKSRCSIARDEWEFTKPKEYSIVTQFELVCDREFYAIVANAIVFVGWGIGGIVLAYASDGYGRRTTIFSSTMVILCTAIISVVADDLILFIISRFIIGFFLGGGVVFVIAAEISSSKYRAVSCTLVWFYFTLAMVLLTVISYFLQNWKKVELMATLPYSFLVFTWSCFPESIRWMRIHGKLTEAEDTLKNIAKLNGKPIPTASLQPEKASSSRSSYIDLFRPIPILVQTILQSIAWFVSGLTYFAAALSSQDLSGSFYMDFIFTSIVEVPANIGVIYFCNRYGRKVTVISHCILGAITFFIVAVTPLSGSVKSAAYVLRLSAGVVGKYASTNYFNSMYIWSAELHPTEIRAQAIGLLLVMSRVGASLSPVIITSLKYIYFPLPFLLMAAFAVLMGTVCLFLPETKDRPIADTMTEYLEQREESSR